MITILWWCLAVILLGAGFLGCFINKIPGPVSVLIAAIMGQTLLKLNIGWGVIAAIAALVVLSMVVSKVVAKLLQKLHEYSKRASWGTTIGSIFGLIVLLAFKSNSTALLILIGVVGFVLLPFAFAFLFELTNKKGSSETLKSASVATGVYLSNTFLKLVVFVVAIYVMFLG